MKRVSFKVAKTTKKAGYPQVGYYWYSPQGTECYSESDLDEIGYVSAPTYFDVWPWLWKEKNIHIEIIDSKITTQCYATINNKKDTTLFDSPEEAIITAIDYLVENNLIK